MRLRLHSTICTIVRRRNYALIVAATLLWVSGGIEAARAQQNVIVLEDVQDYVVSQPRIGRETGIGLVGVVADRASRKGVSLSADLLLPAHYAPSARSSLCITARSQDARFSFQGRALADLSRASGDGRLRVKAELKHDSVEFLKALELSQFALLGRLGACTTGAENTTPTVFALDPWPDANTAIISLRVLLNAPESRVTLAYGAKGQPKTEEACRRSNVKEAGAFATECPLVPPPADLIEVEIRRHRFNNKPLIDKFYLVGPQLSLKQRKP